MRRDDEQLLEAAGQDAFLDVTTNIVGILIILVMVVGLKAQSAPATPAAPTPDVSLNAPLPQIELAALEERSAQIEYDVRRVAQEIEVVEQEASARSAQSVALATAVAGAKREIGDRRAALDSALQEDFDLRRQLAASRGAFERGQAELIDLQKTKPPVQTVKHYPTPLSRTVLGREVHFQLLAGRVAYVPLDEFIDDVRDDMRGVNAMNLNEVTNKVGIAGPRNGFEFRYTVDLVADRNRGVVALRTKEWQLVPVGMQQGEPVEKALSGQSEFRFAIAAHSPRDTTVTLWTYPDSFDAFRQLKEELHRLGFATAGRPLPKGVLIGGSDRGTKSAAQ